MCRTDTGSVWLWEYIDGHKSSVTTSAAFTVPDDHESGAALVKATPIRRAKLKIAGIFEVLSSTIVCMAVFPSTPSNMLSTPKVVRKNSTEYDTDVGQQSCSTSSSSLVALGTAHGTVQLLDLQLYVLQYAKRHGALLLSLSLSLSLNL
jgi:hypothetical protein